ncbi:hypothetical protein DPX16_0726 [Anabarilius grahami]|uniref:Uncharacterized protein n=1 Tax=Anabarilius grahami TaxID=495550 RepID=A0A3N0YUG6_ANAGA|nr:hypothetical protein DPX16_0726 [Anabarilius grahami]
MDAILGDKPSCQPPQILDSFREDDVASSLDFEEPENINVTGSEKNKIESTMDIFAKNIKEALSQADDSELQLKLQAAQHGSSYYPDQVNPPRFGQDYSHPCPFTQDHTRPSFSQNDGHPCPPFYQDYVSAGPLHYSYPPFFSTDRTPVLPPDTPTPKTFTSLQPPPSQQGRISSKPVSSPQPNQNIPEL